MIDKLSYAEIAEISKGLKEQVEIVDKIAKTKGIDELATHNIKVYTHVKLCRGISDYYIGEEKESALDIMHQIESGPIKVKRGFTLGYKQSEGLISMERCPNNTFPIYWMKKNDAPYER